MELPCHCTSPSSGDAYSDRQLTPNFELWVEIFCVPTVFLWEFQNRVCLSVLPREKKSPLFCQYQSYISEWYINGKVFTSNTAWKPKYLIFISTKVKIEVWLVFWNVLNYWNHPSFVNISPTLVIDTSMERSSRVLQHGNPIFFFKKKRSKLNFKLSRSAKHQSFVNINQSCRSN